eukprot:TRINITY_DN3951_c1_g1_i1.p1 TRINITY_DN3951_c1_g1~~TRINITY_DN3951_c1_g1_i1.p1  ORF type:complete len:387 (-),score=65.56 TRINITY_DN3951_c1_g1_i1:83-1243(-)
MSWAAIATVALLLCVALVVLFVDARNEAQQAVSSQQRTLQDLREKEQNLAKLTTELDAFKRKASVASVQNNPSVVTEEQKSADNTTSMFFAGALPREPVSSHALPQATLKDPPSRPLDAGQPTALMASLPQSLWGNSFLQNLTAELQPYADSQNLRKRQWRFPYNIPAVRSDLCPTVRRFGSQHRRKAEGTYPVCMTPRVQSPTCVVYSFGIGFDDGFEIAMATKTQCTVYAFDPTPSVRGFVNRTHNGKPPYKYFSIGLSDKSEKNVTYTNFWTFGKEHHVEMLTFPDVMAKFQHTEVTIVKMDIEGFEFVALGSLLATQANVEQLLLELHPDRPRVWADAILSISAAGFVPFGVTAPRLQGRPPLPFQERFYIRSQEVTGVKAT